MEIKQITLTKDVIEIAATETLDIFKYSINHMTAV